MAASSTSSPGEWQIDVSAQRPPCGMPIAHVQHLQVLLVEAEWDQYYSKDPASSWSTLIQRYKSIIKACTHLRKLKVTAPPPPSKDIALRLPGAEVHARSINALLEVAYHYSPDVKLCLDMSDSTVCSYPRKAVRARTLLKLLAKRGVPLRSLIMRRIRLEPKDIRCMADMNDLEHFAMHFCDYWVPNNQIKYTISKRAFRQLSYLNVKGECTALSTVLSKCSFPSLDCFRFDSKNASHFELPSMPILRRLEGPDWLLSQYILSSEGNRLEYVAALRDYENRCSPSHSAQLKADRSQFLDLVRTSKLPSLKRVELEKWQMDRLAEVIQHWSSPASLVVGWLEPGEATGPMNARCLQVARKVQLRSSNALQGMAGLEGPVLEAVALFYERSDYREACTEPRSTELSQREDAVIAAGLALNAPLMTEEKCREFQRVCLDEFRSYAQFVAGTMYSLS